MTQSCLPEYFGVPSVKGTAASEFNLGGQNESIVGPGRAVLVFSPPPKVFNTDIELFKEVPDRISFFVVRRS